MLSNAVKKELLNISGRVNVSFEKEQLVCYSYDATNVSYLPEGVVFPKNTEEIASILKLANNEGFKVVARGAGTGFSGGSLPICGGVVVSTERMNHINEIDVENMAAFVEPGVITGNLQEEVEDLGLFYPPDPTSFKVSTIGGNIAECAGGPRGVKYGVTKDYVLGLDVVTPTGDVIHTGVKKTLKGVVGYDLTKLMVGSEGTLGVVTGAYLRLLALPEAKSLMLAQFKMLEDAAGMVSSIIRKRIAISALEIMDSVSIRCVEQYAKTGLDTTAALLLIEVDGRKEAVEKDVSDIRAVAKENNALMFKVAEGAKEVKELWGLRRAISPALYRIKPTKINEDVVVPRSNLVLLIKGLEEISRRRSVIIASFGHAGDGNIHVNIMIDKNNPEEVKFGDAAVMDMFELVLRLGGTISGEHGIGISKAPYLKMELTPSTIEVMKGIKKTLDPNGVLNPGKIFSEGVSGTPGRVKHLL